jgi:pimeloyl-ACP methyl ester carboxylesterase
VAPRASLGGGGGVMLLLHEFGWGRFFWQFPGADFAHALAERGHASVAIDRLGYDESDHPEGTGSCLGSQADVAHQIADQLRSGEYAAGRGAAPVRFERVALGGHSGGGAVAELAIHSFGGVDALILFAYADGNFTNRSVQEANEQGLECAAGGEQAEPGGPGGYAYFAQSAEEWKGFMFTSAEPGVADAAAAMRNRDPCGDAATLTPAVVSNNQHAGEITVPALLLYGTSDAIYEQPAAGEAQRSLLSGSPDVTLRFFEGTGHALTLEHSAPEMRAAVADWLAARGF